MWYDYETQEMVDSATAKRTNWQDVAINLFLVYVLVIGGVEVFWYYFAGGFSPLMGGLAFVTATLVAVRTIGEIVVARWRVFR